MRKFRISYLILIFSLLAGNLAPVWSNSLFENQSSKNHFFVNNTDSNKELNAIPAAPLHIHIVRSVKPSNLHQAALKIYKNSLPELHNQLIIINQKIPQSCGNKYLNLIFDFQTIK